jgi:hypothetical protein
MPTGTTVWTLDAVQTHVREATPLVTETFLRTVRAYTWLESPLEAIFVTWWSALTIADEVPFFQLLTQQELNVHGTWIRLDFVIVPIAMELQWAAEAGIGAWVPITVEVDGHGFHERTRTQVCQRDARDRALQRAGWRVFHFSWSELTQNPDTCVHEVYDFSLQQLHALRRALDAWISGPRVAPLHGSKAVRRALLAYRALTWEQRPSTKPRRKIVGADA